MLRGVLYLLKSEQETSFIGHYVPTIEKKEVSLVEHTALNISTGQITNYSIETFLKEALPTLKEAGYEIIGQIPRKKALILTQKDLDTNKVVPRNFTEKEIRDQFGKLTKQEWIRIRKAIEKTGGKLDAPNKGYPHAAQKHSQQPVQPMKPPTQLRL